MSQTTTTGINTQMSTTKFSISKITINNNNNKINTKTLPTQVTILQIIIILPTLTKI